MEEYDVIAHEDVKEMLNDSPPDWGDYEEGDQLYVSGDLGVWVYESGEWVHYPKDKKDG